MAKNFLTNIVVGGKLNPSLKKTFDQAGRIAKKTVTGLGKAGSIGGKALLGIGAAAGAAGALVGGAAVKMMDGFLKNSDSLEKMRAQTGLSYNTLQKLQYVGGQLSVSMNSITKSVGFMNKSMSAATKKGSDARAVFNALGVDFEDKVTGKLRSQDVVFSETIASLSSIKNVSERNAMAFKVFGKGAQEIIPLLDAGTGEISRMSKEAEKMGLILSDDAIKSGDDFGDTLERLKNIGTALGGKLMSGLIGPLQKLADGAIASAPQIMDSLGSVLSSLMPIIPVIAQFAGDLIQQLMPLIQAIMPVLVQLLQAILPSLVDIAKAILPPIIEIIQALMPLLSTAIPIVAEIARIIGVILAGAIKQIMPLMKTWFDILNKIFGVVGGVFSGIGKFLGIGGKKTPQISGSAQAFASGGIATKASIFGEAGPEMAIPLKRNPRSMGLLQKASDIMGVRSGGMSVTYAPQISGGDRQEISQLLKDDFEKFKAWFERFMLDQGRVAF